MGLKPGPAVHPSRVSSPTHPPLLGAQCLHRAYLSHDARAAAAFRTRYQDGYLSRLHDPNVAVSSHVGVTAGGGEGGKEAGGTLLC